MKKFINILKKSYKSKEFFDFTFIPDKLPMVETLGNFMKLSTKIGVFESPVNVQEEEYKKFETLIYNYAFYGPSNNKYDFYTLRQNAYTLRLKLSSYKEQFPELMNYMKNIEIKEYKLYSIDSHIIFNGYHTNINESKKINKEKLYEEFESLILLGELE